MSKFNLDFLLTTAITAFTRDSLTTRMQGKSQGLGLCHKNAMINP